MHMYIMPLLVDTYFFNHNVTKNAFPGSCRIEAQLLSLLQEQTSLPLQIRYVDNVNMYMYANNPHTGLDGDIYIVYVRIP